MTQPTHIQIAPPCPACFWALTTPGYCRMCGWIDRARIQVSTKYVDLASSTVSPDAIVRFGTRDQFVDGSIPTTTLTAHPP